MSSSVKMRLRVCIIAVDCIKEKSSNTPSLSLNKTEEEKVASRRVRMDVVAVRLCVAGILNVCNLGKIVVVI